MQLSFSQGALYGERVDVQIGSTGGDGAQQFGVLQDIQVDFDYTDKELWGQFQFPLAIARGQGKITGKAKFAQVVGLTYSEMFFGLTSATGQFGVSQLEAQTIPTTPYQITVTNAGTYNDDLGVNYTTTGLRLQRVAGPTPAVGQYVVNFATGVYTFAAADTGLAVLISYTYTISASGRKITISNQLQGTTPYFKATFYQQISPSQPPNSATQKSLALRLNACTATKLSLPAKVNDWTINEMDFSAFADTAGIVGYLSTVE
jgi:hypothetical protein